ncbi:carboxypeptidase-like regulatory domain-containing protein [Ichthyenterobacterium sp. W332]|uniref:Carboxypeptidase-like regulatory domain-containing protein n=1 Tax=Microcosmobacter mediterraneus TaxID=3075607 RepID=A0ABU2YM50_9FLAO|nr:carboxypeptidase-like regulatory domain-containing protein [Ichthyenterobacterium sp. W332]MDT0558148.1 carboxypeptidase-like regulatory domain-containing protein [Ichthyenterobacterium sp. W332]
MINKWLCIIVLCCCFVLNAQQITGTVLDKTTKQAIESASIYFDNTTIGTSTNPKGEFSIPFKEEIKSPLIISFLGYKDVIIGNYKNNDNLNILLEESIDNLGEVVINYDDGLTRRQKLRLFRKEFLGSSEFASSCKILNEGDLILRYNREEKVLSANARAPIIIRNKKLQYILEYDIIDFDIYFRYADLIKQQFSVNGVTFSGTTFFKNLEDSQKKKIIKNRKKAYKGSVQHFMRALYAKNLENEGYQIFRDKFIVNPWEHITVTNLEESDWRKVTFKNKLTILFDKDVQSSIQLITDFFYVDKYGNYSPIEGVLFSLEMGNQRLGDALPSDYNVNSN